MSRATHGIRTAGTAALLALLLATAPAAGAHEGHHHDAPAVEVVALESPDSPLVAFRLFFDVGSIHDPEGKEGLAALTAFMVGVAGTEQRTYAELIDALYPMAASINASVDREATVISGRTHRDNLEAYTRLLLEAVLQPAFSEADFSRNKEQLSSYLTDTLRAGNDELLGLEAIQAEIFEGHPYEHPPAGTVEGLASLTLDDVQDFYRRHYTRDNLVLGIAGGFPEGFDGKVARRLARLPANPEGEPEHLPLPTPKTVEGRPFTLIDKTTASVGLHFGYPLLLNRADPDYYPLMVANSFLGEHRTQHGQLMQELRGKRGLNYGDYSYIEYWESPPFTTNPSPGVPRRQQYFSVWLRPVAPDNAQFALRAALFELDQFIEKGMTQEEMEISRDFLVNYSKLWAQSLDNRLGFHLDSHFLGMDYYIDEIETRLNALTLDQVNAAIRKYLHTDAYEAVMVVDDAQALKTALEGDRPSPIAYESEVAVEVLADDEKIVVKKVRPTSVTVVPVEEMFED